MILLMFIGLTCFPYFAGVLLQKMMKGKSGGQIETYLAGVLFLFLLQGAVFEAGVWLKLSFSTACYVFGSLFAAVFLAGALLCGIGLIGRRSRMGRGARAWNRYDRRDHTERGAGVWIAAAALLFLVQAAVICYCRPAQAAADAVAAVVQTTLETDTMYQFHPMTGQLLVSGMVPTHKLVTLPFFYGFLCRVSGLGAMRTVYGLASLTVLFFSYMAFAGLLETVFTGTGKRRKFWMSLTFLGLIYLAGDYAPAAAGSGLLFYGYTGRTVVTAVFLPYVAALVYEQHLQGGGRKQWAAVWLKICLCFAASLFLAPLAEGAFYLGLEMACLGALWLIEEGGRRYRCRKP